MNIDTFLKQNNYHIFYLCNDPERGLGLNFISDNFHIVCIDHTDVFEKLDLEYPGQHFCLEKFTKNYNSIYRSTNELLNNSDSMDFIDSFDGEKYIQVFKVSPQIENRCKDLNLKLLNNSAKLSQYFEDKFNLTDVLKNANLSDFIPNTYLIDISQVSYENSKHIVVQLNRGHTGDGTWIIKSIDDLEKIKEKLFHAEVKVTEFLEGIPVNANGIVTRNGTYVGGLNRQIQDNSTKIAPHPGVTLGNSYDLSFLNIETKSNIISLIQKLGDFMSTKGYKGFFGIDLMILPPRNILNDNEGTGLIKIIEINARQTANVGFFNELQFRNNISPTLSELNLASFFNINTSGDVDNYNNINFSNFEAGQIIIRNYLGRSINYSDLKLDKEFDKFKIHKRNDNHIIKEEQEIFRMQSFSENPLNENGDIRNNLFDYIANKLELIN